VNNAIPVDSDDENLVAELNKNISQSGVLVVKIDANEKKARISPKCRKKGAENSELNCSATASTTGVTLSAAGLYPMIKGFLGRLDTQNRIVVPSSVSLSTSNNNEEDNSAVQLITAKIEFDVFQKKPVKIKSFSKIMTSDIVLKSLLEDGLNTGGLEAINRFITSEVFIPVQVEGVGKDDLFKKSGGSQDQAQVQAQEPEADNQSTI
jgi:hypothetical protein